ncbi:2-phosphosulfolactate phosphatase [Streptomyces sp. NPDC002187]|uniref:2-phosphosulfolactate phosphatase n=1 Tax=Streptomyces sp. NPDC002187 TaxID=3364637 RepID=UPI00369B50B7
MVPPARSAHPARFVGIPDLPAEPPAVAVVVDVMRAFTVAAWAFARGAQRIVLASSADEALDLKARHAGRRALKDGAPAEGFDAVNSPGMIATATGLTGRTMVQVTTAGTVGVLAVAGAPLVLCASFAVAGATARFLRCRGTGQATYVVTGDAGRAEEDLACAEFIEHRVHCDSTDPAPFLTRARTSRAAADLAEGLRRGYRGVHPDDVRLCLEADRFPFAMAASRENGLMAVRPVPEPGIMRR